MFCYYHGDISSQAVCKQCYRALCRECISPNLASTACKDRCEDEVIRLDRLIHDNMKASGSRLGFLTNILLSTVFVSLGITLYTLNEKIPGLLFVAAGIVYLAFHLMIKFRRK